MLHACLGATLGGSAVALFYEFAVVKRNGGGKTFAPASTATLLVMSGNKINSGGATAAAAPAVASKKFPTEMLPTTTETLFVAPGEAYICDFSTVLRTPRWVLEVIDNNASSSDDSTSSVNRSFLAKDEKGDRAKSKFYSNETVPEVFRATNSDYAAKYGMSRGHMAAAQFHKQSQEQMDASFDLSMNIVPQDMTVNACDWLRLENLQKKLSKEFVRTFVLTGPAMVPKTQQQQQQVSGTSKSANTGRIATVEYEVIGSTGVAVPTHLWKCILGQSAQKQQQRGGGGGGGDNNNYLGCFLMANAPITDEQPLTAFEVPVERIETLTGVRPFLEQRTSYSSMLPMCKHFKCDAAGGSFSRNFRAIGQIRAARSKHELEMKMQQLSPEMQADSKVLKEFELKSKFFT